MTAVVLIVDDDETLRLVLSKQLKRLGYAARLAANCIEATKAAFEHDFAVILMDVQMPCMDWLEAGAAIRRKELEINRKRTPIIAVTANPDRERCFRAGMDDFLFKPVLLSDLQKILDRWSAERISK